MNGQHLAFVQPLPVMTSEGAVAELQQLWATMALAAAQGSACATAATQSAEISPAVPADDVPHATADVAEATADLSTQQLYAAWQTGMAPLLVDLTYVLGSCQPGVAASGSQDAAQRTVMQNLLEFLVRNEMWQTVQAVVTCSALQATQELTQQAASTNHLTLQSKVLSVCRSMPGHVIVYTTDMVVAAAGQMLTAVHKSGWFGMAAYYCKAVWAALTASIQHVMGVVTSASSSVTVSSNGVRGTATPAAPSSSNGNGSSSSSSFSSDLSSSNVSASDAAHEHSSSQNESSTKDKLLWLTRGFRDSTLEHQYLAYKQSRTVAADVFMLFYYSAIAMLTVTSYPPEVQHLPRVITCKVLVLGTQFVIPSVIVALRPKLPPGTRDTSVALFFAVHVVLSWTLLFDIFDYPVIIQRLAVDSAASTSIIFLLSNGFLKPCAHQVSPHFVSQFVRGVCYYATVSL